MGYNSQICPKMLGSRVIAVFAHLEDCFELSKRVHKTMHDYYPEKQYPKDSYGTVLAKV